MLSTLQKTFSDAISSFTSTKEPKLLKRPSSDISTPPNDPAIFRPAAHMPPSRSSTASKTDTKRHKGGKAAEFLRRHFDVPGEEDDPIESSSPPDPLVWRTKESSHPTAVKKQESLPNSVRPNVAASKPKLNHQHLLVDPDERSLFAGNSPPDSDAVFISVPGSRTSNKNSSSSTMRSSPYNRPFNTLDSVKNNHVSSALRNHLQKPRVKQVGSLGSNSHGLNPDYPGRIGTGEPPSKRQRIEHSSKPYVKNEGTGFFSPMFTSTANEDVVITKSRPAESPSIKHFQSSKKSGPPPLNMDEYQSGEDTMRSSPLKRDSYVEISPHFAAKLLNRHQSSEDSDPEEFTRESKKARYQQQAQDPHECPMNSPGPMNESCERQNDRYTPSPIAELFRPSMLPSNEGYPNRYEEGFPQDLVTAESVPELVHGRDTRVTEHGSDPNVTESRSHRSRTVAKSGIGKNSKHRPKNGNPGGAGTFPLRHLSFGFLPDKESYYAEVSENSLRIYDTESTLSKDPIWPPIQLSKILKVFHGSDDLLKLILHMSQCQGQSSNKIHLELASKADKENFLSLIPGDMHQTLRMRKDDEYIRKCFERRPEASRGTQQQPAEPSQQPISNQRQSSGKTSPHFQNQQTASNNISRQSRLINQLQSTSLASAASGADSKIPTIISGRERANQSSTTSAERISSLAKRRIPDQIQSANRGRLRPSSTRAPITRSGLAEMSTNDSKHEVPKKKYSEIHGFGEPWKTPLIYPQAGKRRMAVEFEDLRRLDEDELLNDNLIGFFLRYLEHHLQQTDPELAQRVYFYNSFFFERLTHTSKGKKGIDYESVQKWTRNVDIFDHDFVIVPVNESLHWYVVIICNLPNLNPYTEDEGEDLGTETSPSGKPAITSEEGEDELQRGPEMEDADDRPTEKTTESLSHLSLSDHEKQLDELAPSNEALSSLSSPRPGSASRKSWPGRRKRARRSLPKYKTSIPVMMTLDSLGLARSSTCTALRQYIVEEARDKKGWDLDGSLIKGMTAKGIPTQPNYSDCGLYLCAYVEKFVLSPGSFVSRILQREMDPNTDMPMMASQELRSRMRGFIRELHNEQEGEETEFPIPDVGKILLASTRTFSEDDIPSAPRTPLQDESEDELQRDQTSLKVHSAARSPPAHAHEPSREANEDLSTSAARLPEKSSPSKTSTVLKDMLAKINAPVPTPSQSISGTKDTAITIDDDEDLQPAPKSISAKLKTPIAKDDFFEHPSELKDAAVASKTSTPRRRAEESLTEVPVPEPRRRSQSIGSAITVNTDYLSGNGNKSYQHDDNRRDEEGAACSRPGPASRQEIVVVVPDSQESKEVEIEEVEGQVGGDAKDEAQSILEGVE